LNLPSVLRPRLGPSGPSAAREPDPFIFQSASWRVGFNFFAILVFPFSFHPNKFAGLKLAATRWLIYWPASRIVLERDLLAVGDALPS